MFEGFVLSLLYILQGGQGGRSHMQSANRALNMVLNVLKDSTEFDDNA